MKHTYLAAPAAGVLLSSVSGLACADFFADSKASLLMQNYYFNSDYRDEVSSAADQQSKREEWAQGFTLNFTSGYTEGTVGFGVDVLGMYGIKLDSSPGRSNSGLLASSATPERGGPGYARRAEDNYAKLGVTPKIRYAKSELRTGTLLPTAVPVLYPNMARLFPQTFRGTELQSRDIDHLLLRAGYVDRVKQRDSTDFEPMTLDTRNNRFRVTHTSDDFRYAGADYQASPNLTLSYYYGTLEDLYQQHYVGFKHVTPLGSGKLTSEVRAFFSQEAGSADAGDIDNTLYTGNFAYALGAHTFSGGYQSLSGTDAFPFISGAGAYSATEIMVSNFTSARENTWWARYDYDFTALGIPGLTFYNRYMSGSNAEINGMNGSQKEWERNTEIAYAIRSGTLKNFSVRLRNATYRSTFNRDVDQTRIILSYNLPLL